MVQSTAGASQSTWRDDVLGVFRCFYIIYLIIDATVCVLYNINIMRFILLLFVVVVVDMRLFVVSGGSGA